MGIRLWFSLIGLCAWPLSATGQAPAFTLEASLQSAAYHEPGAPDVIVHGPRGFDARKPLHLVVFLHGYRGCTRVLMRAGSQRCKEGARPRLGWNLAARHDAAQTNTLLVMPQLAYMQRSGRPGCFAKEGCFRAFAKELLERVLGPHFQREWTLQQLASVTLVAHSAGFETALAILEHGGLPERIHNVVLFDALYSGADRFARWLARDAPPGAKLLSIHLGRGKTRSQSRRLYRRAQRTWGAERVAQVSPADIGQALASHRLVVARGKGGHRAVPERYLAQVLKSLGLPPR